MARRLHLYVVGALLVSACSLARADEGAVKDLIERFRPAASELGFDLPTWEAETARLLEARSPEELAAALKAETYDGLRAAIGLTPIAPRADAGSTYWGPDDLSFWPLEPCRIVDTTRAAGSYAGRLLPGVPRHFSHTGDLVAQGGSAADCGVPGSVTHVLVSINTFSPLDWGFLTAWPFAQPQPARATLDYPASPYQHAATTTVLPVCQACGYDFSLAVSGPGATHVMVDVLGYFAPINRQPMTCATQDVITLVPAGGAAFCRPGPCSEREALTYAWVSADPALLKVQDRGPNDTTRRWEFLLDNLTGASQVVRCHARCCATVYPPR